MLARQLYEGIITDNLYSNQVYLEIGSYDGEGIAMLSNKFPDKTFYSIDPFIEDGHTSGNGVGKGDLFTAIREVFYNNTKDCDKLLFPNPQLLEARHKRSNFYLFEKVQQLR